MMTFKIEGMTCGHCVHAVTRALAAVPGVARVVDVSLERGDARIEGSPDPGAVATAMQNEGYVAALVSA